MEFGGEMAVRQGRLYRGWTQEPGEQNCVLLDTLPVQMATSIISYQVDITAHDAARFITHTVHPSRVGRVPITNRMPIPVQTLMKRVQVPMAVLQPCQMAVTGYFNCPGMSSKSLPSWSSLQSRQRMESMGTYLCF